MNLLFEHSFLTFQELSIAEEIIISKNQVEAFQQKYAFLQNSEQAASKSQLLQYLQIMSNVRVMKQDGEDVVKRLGVAVARLIKGSAPLPSYLPYDVNEADQGGNVGALSNI